MKKSGPAFEIIGGSAADEDITRVIQDTFDHPVDAMNWWLSLVDLVAGPNHGLRLARISDTESETIEVFGAIPKSLGTDLCRYPLWHGHSYSIQWIDQSDEWGKRYEFKDLSDFLNLLAERRALMEGRSK